MLKTVKSENDLVVGREYSDNGIRSLVYQGKQGDKYKFYRIFFNAITCIVELDECCPIFFTEDTIKKLKYHD